MDLLLFQSPNVHLAPIPLLSPPFGIPSAAGQNPQNPRFRPVRNDPPRTAFLSRKFAPWANYLTRIVVILKV
jgi:hypothetical protein